jgi:thiol-disulfide isomerase/thioredoxin
MKSLFLVFFISLSIQLSAQQTLPSIQLKNTKNEKIDIKEACQEGLFMVSFWASWCVSCINELDEINDVYEDWVEETGVKIIAVATDDSRTVARVIPLINGKGWEYEVLFDTNQELKRSLNIASIPYVMIVNNGGIVYQHSGYAPGQEDEIFEELKKYAEKK